MAHSRQTAPRDRAGSPVPIRVVGPDGTAERTLVSMRLPDDYALRASRLDRRATAGDGVVVVSDDFSTVYGAGDDLDAAVADYLAALVGHLVDLEDQEAILAPGLRQELAALRRHITRTT